MIGLGLVSFERPEYRTQAVDAISTHCLPVVDFFTVIADTAPVGVAKNNALSLMIESGCDWLFLAEDDVLPLSSKAITGYIDACEQSGYEHLMFHGHGPHNPKPTGGTFPITLWPNYVGAWSIYSRNCLEKCGLFDESFHNAWEHVEHTLRLSLEGFTPPWRGAADATGSENWLREIPGSIENSVIRPSPDWSHRMLAGQDYWKEAHPETYRLVFGHG